MVAVTRVIMGKRSEVFRENPLLWAKAIADFIGTWSDVVWLHEKLSQTGAPCKEKRLGSQTGGCESFDQDAD